VTYAPPCNATTYLPVGDPGCRVRHAVELAAPRVEPKGHKPRRKAVVEQRNPLTGGPEDSAERLDEDVDHGRVVALRASGSSKSRDEKLLQDGGLAV
jgi:hypothetical protein